jgi:hypothetical protein
VRFPCVHAAATTPVQQMGVLVAQTAPSISAFPDSTVGSACTSSFSRFARRSLALRPAHSRNHQIRDRYPGASDISSPPCLPRLLPAGANRRVGLAPTGKSAALSRRTWTPVFHRQPPERRKSHRFRSFAGTRWNRQSASGSPRGGRSPPPSTASIMRSCKSRDSGAGMTSPQPIKNRLAEISILQRKPNPL